MMAKQNNNKTRKKQNTSFESTVAVSSMNRNSMLLLNQLFAAFLIHIEELRNNVTGKIYFHFIFHEKKRAMCMHEFFCF